MAHSRYKNQTLQEGKMRPIIITVVFQLASVLSAQIHAYLLLIIQPAAI